MIRSFKNNFLHFSPKFHFRKGEISLIAAELFHKNFQLCDQNAYLRSEAEKKNYLFLFKSLFVVIIGRNNWRGKKKHFVFSLWTLKITNVKD